MHSINRLIAGTVLACASVAQAAPTSTFVGARDDFRDETIYFAMTTRFYDGDPQNNVYCWDGVLNEKDPEWRGDFKGLISKLDYIKALGFTSVWITPVVENASGLDYHGYHAFNFQKVDPRYESEDCKFKDLIDAAHARGMKIVLDIVLNHTGNFGEEKLCPMFVKDYSQNLSNIHKSMKLHPNTVLPADYDLADPKAHDPRINALKNEDGINHDHHNYYHHVGNEWNWDDYSRWYAQIAGDCVDLNTENPAVSNYLVECYGKFIEMGVDGFRIDTSGHISRLTFNKAFIPQFEALAEKHKAARNGGPFFMYGEVCARDRNVTYRNHANCSPYFYTWKEEKDYAWDYSETSWDNVVNVNHGHGDHINIKSQDQQGEDYHGDKNLATSDNAFLKGNAYHKPDHSMYSGFSVIDFPMHWNFASTRDAWGVRGGDKYYNDATYNVVYVDSHDYAPDGAPENQRFSKGQDVWASNLSLMFTFRGIPCLYYGSEIEFKKGSIIDKGALLALKDSGRAYFGGYIEGDVTVSDFAQYSAATGNMAASLSHPLSLHIQRLNKIRAAIPALRKGQYSTEGCTGSGVAAFKRRYTDSTTDSYVLVTIGGAATFTGVENGTYTDAITGDVQTVTNGTLKTKACSGSANMRIYVLSTALTPAPGKIGTDGKYLFDTAAVNTPQSGYDGNEEPDDTWTVKDTEQGGGGGEIEEPEVPVAPSMAEGEQAVFFENTADWGGTMRVYAWNGGTQYAGAWSGAKMTYLGNKVWKWTYTGSGVIPATAGVIFNNGSSQTDDFTWINGGYYNASGYVRTIEGAGEIVTPPVNPTEPFSVYFDNSASAWAQVYVYMWDDAGTLSAAWPGTAMTDKEIIAGKEHYKFTYTPDRELSSPKVIFNVGSNQTQTADLQLVPGGIYTAQGYTGQTGIANVNPDAELTISVVDGRLIVRADSHATVTVTRADGITTEINVHPGVNTIDLPRGFYIVNRTKIIL
ncbi:MAG: alpha-amylase family glycosyl hydrolase [Muribaculaceae bacterium]|nr:alpha-amylase family glycosyl hydrolase [Muribaculaceae bacterium]